jgi:hypothetical protein
MNNIENWQQLTEQQKEIANFQLKNVQIEKNNEPHPTSVFFNTFGWVKIENFISKDLANILYSHITLAAQRLTFLENMYGVGNVDKSIWGDFYDPQAYGDYSHYGDLIFETLLLSSLEKMNLYTNKKLVPTYSYHRLYTTGTELERHIDRKSCEISTTLCLGYDVSNVDSQKYPDWDWPMFIKTFNGETLPVHMKPGDMLIYRGCDIEHWREPFIGKNHAQVFLHYNEKNDLNDNIYDGRPMLGLPSRFSKNKIKDVYNLKENKIIY